MAKENPEPAALRLPAKLNTAEAGALKTMIAADLDRPLQLDAADVSMFGAQCLQVLLAARNAWTDREIGFEVVNLPADMVASLQVFGVSPEQIGAQEVDHDG